jgi:hypothetical protein
MLDIISPDPLALSVIGSVYVFNGSMYRVCAGSAAAVKVATVKALNRMRIKVASIDKDSGQDVILAMSGERRVEVRVEALDPKSSRMQIFAQQGEKEDVQTAAEVVACTERMLTQSAPLYA